MEIRNAGFWQDIEQLFSEQDVSETRVPQGRGSRLISSARFADRLQVSQQRARRNKRYALLILIQLTATDRDAGIKTQAQVNELLVCRLSSCLRSNDSLCDLGNGRYALLMEDIREPSAVPLVIEKLLTTLMGSLRAGAEARWAQPNLGATLFPVEGLAFDQIWASAEAALEQAGGSGPGSYSISPMVTGQAAMERFELSKDLYRAYRNSEFETVYQPIIDLKDRHIRAVEAFIRWRHPVRGHLYPETFLPLLEESGVIAPVGEKMLADVCKLMRSLLNSGCEPFRVCVNISARQLEDGGFLLSVLDALYDADLDPACLQLEFPESVLAQQPELVRRLMPELRNAGVRLAMDHFGVGDSSVADLMQLPIDLIKIDRSLINKLPEDPASRAIASGTLAVANAAGMQVAAVGVEQVRQTGVVQELGCREAQGRYYFCPLTDDELRFVLYD